MRVEGRALCFIKSVKYFLVFLKSYISPLIDLSFFPKPEKLFSVRIFLFSNFVGQRENLTISAERLRYPVISLFLFCGGI